MQHRFGRILKKTVFFILALIAIFCFIYMYALNMIPDELILIEGKEYVYNLHSIYSLETDDVKNELLYFETEKGKRSDYFRVYNPVLVKTRQTGSLDLNLSIFGLIPVKTIKVNVIPDLELVACGNTVGVKINLDGILVIGMMEVETIDGQRILPVRNTGIKPGDFITKVNGEIMENVSDLIRQIEKSQGRAISIQYRRGNELYEATVQPVMSIDDKEYHIGLWVRDNTAGIGTLTFYEPNSMSFGALGHGITDVDTGVLMPVKKGEIMESSILGIEKSRNGTPGELKGIFVESRGSIGQVSVNSAYGVYGKLNDKIKNIIPERIYPIAVRTEVKEGPAIILANVLGQEVNEYTIEIEKVFMKSNDGSKGMIIRITDEKLLDITGGIVQGMSGSPIIQNGKIVGAVTHVLVNDPTKGYGIFIDCMVKKMQENNAVNATGMRKAG